MGAADTKESRSRDSTEYVFRGCTGRCTNRDEHRDHLATCPNNPYAAVLCTLKCGSRIERRNLMDHTSNKCLLRVIGCKFCGKVFYARDIEIHEKNCDENPSKVVRCPEQCGQVLEKRNLLTHSRITCPNRLLLCIHCKKPCQAKILQFHQSNCEMAPVTCPSGCGEIFRKSELKRHQSQLCKMRELACHYCGKIFAAKDFLDHMKMCPEVPIPCPQCSAHCPRRCLPEHLSTTCPERQVSCERCNLSFKAKEKDAHEASCDLAEAACPKMCGKCLLRKDIAAHLKEECPFRDVSCLLCQEILPNKHLSDHLQVCNKRLVSCSYCEEKGIVYDQLEHHYKTCYKKPQPCPYAALGCQYQGLQDDLEDHQEEFQTHWPLLTRSAELAIKLNQEMSMEIENLGSENREVSLNLKTVLHKQEALERELEEMKDNYEDEGDAALRVAKTVNYSQFKSIIDISENNQWKVSDYSKLKQRMQTTFVWSKSLYTTGKRGYHFALGMRIHFTKSRKKNKIGLFIALFKGPYDDELKWPFPYTVRFSLLCHGLANIPDHAKPPVRELCVVSRKRRKINFDKPKRSRNMPVGRSGALLLEELENPSNGYIKNDELEFLVEVCPT